MYFWNIQALRRDLQVSRPGEGEVFGYFLAVLMLETLIWESGTLWASNPDPGFWDVLGLVGNLTIMLIGTVLAYRANDGANGRDFLARYFPLFWVLTIRFLAISIPILAAVFVVVLSLAGGDTEAETGELPALVPALALTGWVLMAWFYYRLVVHMQAVANPGSARA